MARPHEERLALARKAARLRAAGLVAREIATELGISRSYASALLTDPDGAKEIARKESYRGTCVECGAPTTGCDGPGLARERCKRCSHEAQHLARYWTRDRIIAALQAWAVEHGQQPTSKRWVQSKATPGFMSIYGGPRSPFASWNEAVEAAGFKPLQSGRGWADLRDMEAA